MRNPVGRPTVYSYELAQRFCERLTTTDRGVDNICRDDDMPGKSTIWRWLSKFPEFWEMYTRARDFQTELLYDELQNIATEELPETDRYTKEGVYIGQGVDAGVAMAEMQRRKLIIDVIKFKLAKLQPKRFGDNRNLSLDVKVNHKLSPEQFNSLLQVAAAAPQIEAPREDYEEAQEVTDDEQQINGEDLLK